MSKKIHVRPSGTQSKLGFVVGIAFCLIGLFVAIPMFGPFGIVWTAIAGFITYSNWRNGYTDRKIDTHVIEIEDTDPENVTVTSHRGFGTSYSVSGTERNSAGYGSGSDIENRLKSLQSLYDQRLITREEYEEKKQEILKEL
ncbi:MAG: SHOCT domain-containing protein [Lachnospiraceae bacterium]|nr:SHOCT domain-containing protein [Lachnospiraceae bacterium]